VDDDLCARGAQNSSPRGSTVTLCSKPVSDKASQAHLVSRQLSESSMSSVTANEEYSRSSAVKIEQESHESYVAM
jgi:hypothetical protein